MRARCFVTLTLILALLVLFSPCSSYALMTEYKPGYQIATLVKDSDLVVVGRVINTQFVFRDNFAPQFTTDITLEVESLIKGAANAGEGTVKFMIKGGHGVNPNTGRELIVGAEHSPTFKSNERVLVFLKISNRAELNYPYGGYYVYRGRIGKRLVRDDKIAMPYTFTTNLFNPRTGTTEAIKVKKFIDLPIELAVELGKASDKDFEAILPLEEEIKTVVSTTPAHEKAELTEEKSDNLKDRAKQITDKIVEK